MVSECVGPIPGALDALSDLALLVSTNGKELDDWLKQPITRLVLAALDEASAGRLPRIGLQVQEYAQAVGEVAGMQRAVLAIRNPKSFLEFSGVRVGAPVVKLPTPSYKPREDAASAPAPEPTPAKVA